MDKKTELELVEKAKKNIQAFNKLYDYYKAKVLGYCINRLSNIDIAEEITSDVFLSAVESIKDFDTKRNIRFGSWLYSVAHNKIIDYFRKKKALPLDEDYKSQISETQDLTKDLVQDEMHYKIAKILSLIKPRYQEIISLRYFAELENDEIAKILKINKNNVAVLIHRALKSFKKEFENTFPETEIFELF
ncbi:sigma-70 family RNA polymerase sigma factor [Candidatus Dojkabacteria bacterium]|nr:sigma-70 family RNA polymerase sigma factor [Candidatus Dojkabacteria bacterium]